MAACQTCGAEQRALPTKLAALLWEFEHRWHQSGHRVQVAEEAAGTGPTETTPDGTSAGS